MPSIEQEHCSQCDEVGPLLACDDSDGRDKSTANKPRYDIIFVSVEYAVAR